jgi:thiamine pyrophosphate-dependent acetolactate synthase large subunit-like protein
MLETSPARPAASLAKGAPARAVFEVLRAWGVDHVFTCPGSTEAAFLDASGDYPDVRLVLVTHESIAIAAADGYTRVTGRPAVAYLHTNVGLANCVAHLDCVQLARSPVVILNGMKSTEIQNRGGFTTASHQRDYVRQHVVYDRIALRPDQVAEDLVRALKAATAEPGGPVYLGLPQDIMESPVPLTIPDVKRRRVAARRRPDPESVAEAARRLSAARRLIIVAGSEVARHGAQAEFAGPRRGSTRPSCSKSGARCNGTGSRPTARASPASTTGSTPPCARPT